MAGLAAVVLTVAACTSPPGDDGSGSSPPDAAVLRSYVEALADGNVEQAIDLRCTNGRPKGEAIEQFGADLKQLTDALGEPDLVRVSENDPPPMAGAWVEGGSDDPEERWREELDAVELKYWISFDGVESDHPQFVVVLDEEGERRICGHVTHAADHIFKVIDDDISDAGLPLVSELSDLMPAGVGDNYEQVEDHADIRADVPESLPGSVEGYTRAWQDMEQFGGVRVSAFRFSSPEEALDWAGYRARTAAGDAVQQFDAPGLRGAVGVRTSASAWLLIQPTGEPPFLDRVDFVAGDVGVEIAIAHLDADTSMAVAISHQVADLART